jgi:hypothetical protein
MQQRNSTYQWSYTLFNVGEKTAAYAAIPVWPRSSPTRHGFNQHALQQSWLQAAQISAIIDRALLYFAAAPTPLDAGNHFMQWHKLAAQSSIGQEIGFEVSWTEPFELDSDDKQQWQQLVPPSTSDWMQLKLCADSTNVALHFLSSVWLKWCKPLRARIVQ